MKRFSRFQVPVIERLGSMGPGAIFALSVIGAGDIIANSAAGADYGYSLLWMLAVTLIFRFTWVGTSAKYVLVSEETLLAGYNRIGRGVSWVLLGAIIVLRHVSNLYKVVLFGPIASFFIKIPGEHSDFIWSLLISLAGFGVMFWSGYTQIERFFKLLVVGMGATLIIGAIYSRPDITAIAQGLLMPTFPHTQGFYDLHFLVMAMIGTEAGSMTNMTYTYFMREKGWSCRKHLRAQRLDLLVSVGCIFALGAFVQIIAAGTLGRDHRALKTVQDLLNVLNDGPGFALALVFGLGLMAAVFTGFVGATSGYALIVTDLIRNVLPAENSSRIVQHKSSFKDPIYRFFVAFWALSPLYILFTNVGPVWLLLAASAFSVVAIPFLAFCLLRISNNRQIMGSFTNKWPTNLILWLMGLSALYLCLHRAWTWLTS